MNVGVSAMATAQAPDSIGSQRKLTVLIAPNVSEQMGGEAMKALQIFRAIRAIQPDTIQITHARNRKELSERLRLPNVIFIEDTAVSLFLWRSVAFRWLLDTWFSHVAVKRAEAEGARRGLGAQSVVIHQTEPNSPVLPRAYSKHQLNVLGPINGNIYYPRTFRGLEKLMPRLRRILHMPIQRLNRLLFRGLAKADLIFVAGGKRTYDSLFVGGCSPTQLTDSLDCGISDSLLQRPRIQHSGANLTFVHFGRLVLHKGTFLIIESLKKTQHPVRLDIVGTGPELEACRALTSQLGLDDRVRFLGWYTRHEELLDSLRSYRGMVLPTMEDANGIVVQEAMALGLPPICLDWGGPQLLIDHGKDGYLVEPHDKEFITAKIAEHLDFLSQNGAVAEQMSVAARTKAGSWQWSQLAEDWLRRYPVAKRSAAPLNGAFAAGKP